MILVISKPFKLKGFTRICLKTGARFPNIGVWIMIEICIHFKIEFRKWGMKKKIRGKVRKLFGRTNFVDIHFWFAFLNTRKHHMYTWKGNFAFDTFFIAYRLYKRISFQVKVLSYLFKRKFLSKWTGTVDRRIPHLNVTDKGKVSEASV